jgi:hypothetical protein
LVLVLLLVLSVLPVSVPLAWLVPVLLASSLVQLVQLVQLVPGSL